MCSDDEDYGDIEGLHTEAHILWHIPNYFSRQKADSVFKSPLFHFLGSTWSLEIYPNGQRIDQSVEFVGLYVIRKEVYVEHEVLFRVAIVHDDFKLHERRGNFYLENFSLGWDKFVERRIIQRNQFRIAPHGTLTVKLVGKPLQDTVVHTESQTKILDGMSALSRDFHTLLGSEETSDVKIWVKSRVFHAHKLILGARSAVFDAMFKHDMKERNTGSVHIKDCDPSSFQEFLLFLYTGKIDKLSSDNVFDIFSLSTKYDISDLRKICIDFMEENLCLNMVCEVLSIADKFDVVELKKSAKELFLKNRDSVMSTENWINFIRENPILATEVLKNAFSQVYRMN